QPSEQTIFLSQSSRLGHETRPQRQAIRSAQDQTTTTDNQTSLRSGNRTDHVPTPTPDHRQTRLPDQISPQTTIHDCSRTPNLVKWYRLDRPQQTECSLEAHLEVFSGCVPEETHVDADYDWKTSQSLKQQIFHLGRRRPAVIWPISSDVQPKLFPTRCRSPPIDIGTGDPSYQI
ncbi:unnamed protein product, partial [Porites evermanni]